MMEAMFATSADGLAVLALTSRLGLRGGADEPAPVTPRTWARVQRTLDAMGLRPADLLGRDARELGELLGAPSSGEAIARLAARATTLSLEIERLNTRGVWVLSIADEPYPHRLRDRLGDAAPTVLFGVGAQSLLQAGGVAIVGSRDADAAAIDFAEQAGAAVAHSGRPVVSGGARGIDAAAMRGAADAGGTVVGVLADNLERAAREPTVRGLARDDRLILLSPYGPAVPFSAGNAMGRNRLIYCMADAAVVVVTSEGSGGTWAGATEALKACWVPVHVQIGEGMPSGNGALAARGAIAMTDGPEAAGDLGRAPIVPEAAEEPASHGAKVAEQQTLFGGEPEPIAVKVPRKRPKAARPPGAALPKDTQA